MRNETLVFSYPLKTQLVFCKQLLDKSEFHNLQNRAIVFLDPTVNKLYGNKLRKAFNKETTQYLLVKKGEKAKTFQEVQRLLKKLSQLYCTKDVLFIAIGGGSVLDLVGFIGSIYLRGVLVHFIPTTLLSMVDACIGGKTGINTSFGKNLIGTFSMPEKVFLDFSFLKTLSKKQIKEGASELIKHFIIRDKQQFTSYSQEKNKLSLSTIENYLPTSLAIKKEIIQIDPLDQGIRKILNFGHTVGHALEKGTNYTLFHGFAVALGMLAESFLSKQRGLLSEGSFNQIQTVLSFILEKKRIDLEKEAFFKAFFYDKKNEGKKIQTVLLQEIGQCFVKNERYVHSLSTEEIQEIFLFLQGEGYC